MYCYQYDLKGEFFYVKKSPDYYGTTFSIIPAYSIGAISAVIWVVAYAIGVAVKRLASRSYA